MSTSVQSPNPSSGNGIKGIVSRAWQFFKKQNLLGKILLTLIPVCGLCFLCIVPVALVSPARTPTPQSSAQNPLASRTPAASALSQTRTPSLIENETEVAPLENATATEGASNPTIITASTPTESAPLTLVGILNTNANVRESPTTSGRVVVTLQKGERVEVRAQNENGDWLQIEQGWIFANLVDIQGDRNALPVGSAIEVETPTVNSIAELTSTPTSQSPHESEPSPVPTRGGGDAISFGEGMQIIGTDIPAGTYRSLGGSRCFWERLSGFGGTLEEIVANDISSGPAVVSIAANDKGFNSSRCGTWTQDLSPITDNPTAAFTDGTFIVRTDISPGTWRSSASDNCYWMRLSGFSGELKDVIANDVTKGQAIVTIGADDAGFSSTRCGTWTKIE